ncbi:MAG: M6 family metalloprotease domain-containing protein, partial [Eubacterium sp.]|nr:M6 family metalloprotease domain-containing protein [Eubacterium sp.]
MVKRKRYEFVTLIILSFALSLFFCGTVYAEDNNENGDEEVTPYYGMLSDVEGYMPTTGNVKALVLMVEFPDYPHRESLTQDYVQNRFFGETNSLREYYQNASYGKLNISGDVYGWYMAKKNREDYDGNNKPPRAMVFEEVVEYYDDIIDYSDYDSDNDGYVDCIYIYYAGEDTGFGTSFWSYAGDFWYDEKIDGVSVNEGVWLNSENDEDGNWYSHVAEHETGHLLGLPDLYDSDIGEETIGLYVHTLMSDSSGELDAFSKILLGWIKPIEISSDEGEIDLKPISNEASAVILYDEGAKHKDTFVLIEFEAQIKNEFEPDSKIRMYRVNPRLKDEYDIRHFNNGHAFVYGMGKDAEIKLISALDHSGEPGEKYDDNTAPTLSFLYENEGNVERLSSNLHLEIKSIKDNIAKMNYYYQETERQLSFIGIKSKVESNQVSLLMEMSTSILHINDDKEIYLKVDGSDEKIKCTQCENNTDLFNDMYPQNNYIWVRFDKGKIKENTDYKVVIEEGKLEGINGAINQEITTSISVGKLTEQISVVDLGDLYRTHYTDVLPYNNSACVLFQIIDNTLVSKVFYVDKEPETNILQYYDANITDNDFLVACQLDNKDYVVVARVGGNTIIYRIDNNLKVKSVIDSIDDNYWIPDGINWNIRFSAVGNDAVYCEDSYLLVIKPDNSYCKVDKPSNIYGCTAISKIPNTELYSVGIGDARKMAIMDESYNFTIFEKKEFSENKIFDKVDDYYLSYGLDDNFNPKIIYYNSEFEPVYVRNINMRNPGIYGGNLRGIIKIDSVGYLFEWSIGNTDYFEIYDNCFEFVSSYAYTNGDLHWDSMVYTDGSFFVRTGNYVNTFLVDGLNYRDPDEVLTFDVDYQILKFNNSFELVLKDLRGEVIDSSSIKWYSSDESIAVVEDGFVKAYGNGRATIYGEYNGGSAMCIVDVYGRVEKIQFQDILFDTVKVGEGFYIIFHATPYSNLPVDDFDPTFYSDYEVEFSKDNIVELVSFNGSIISFKAKHSGDVTVKVKYKYDNDVYETFDVSVIDHDYGELIAEVPATCTEDGVQSHYECSECHKLFVKVGEDYEEKTAAELKIDALGHDMTEHEAKEATCETDGNGAYWNCSRCKKFFSDEEGETEIEENSWIIPAAGHEYGELIAEVPATCTDDGMKAHYECSVCHKLFVKNGDEYEEKTAEELKIAATGHEFDQEKAEEEYLKNAADCTHAAVYYKSCKCGAKGTETFEHGNALGHDMT